MELNPNIYCIKHNQIFKLLCNQCNLLLCIECSNQHLKEFNDHTCDHINKIRKFLLNIKEKDDINNNYQLEINNIWKNIKESKQYLDSLESKENDISNFFRDFHEYLRLEEHRLKKPIIEDIETINNKINQQINQLQSLLNIVRINNHTLSTTNNNTQDLSLSTDSAFNLNDDTKSLNQSYSTEIINQLIKESDTLNHFIDNLKFDQPINIDEYKLNLNNDIELVILELLVNHNKSFNHHSSLKDNHKNESIYRINIHPIPIQEFKQLLSKSINVQQISSSLLHNNENRNNNKALPYILSTHSNGKGTLFDISDHKNIKPIEIIFPYKNYHTFNSFARINDLIYIFGGFDKSEEKKGNNKYCIFSVKNQSIAYQGTIDTVKGGHDISVCYDGGDFIYMVNGYDDSVPVFFDDIVKISRVDRFNIRSKKFEQLYNSKSVYDPLIPVTIFSFIYDGLLYSLKANHTIETFNTTTNKMENTLSINKLPLNSKPLGACTDGNGNIYLHTHIKKFIRFNVKTKESVQLTCIDFNATNFHSYLSMVYKESFIYIFGGRIFGNHCYSINSDQWFRFGKDDNFDRNYCGSS